MDRDVCLPARNRDVRFVEDLKDRHRQIGADSSAFCDVSDECVKRETETCSGELVQSDGGLRRCQDLRMVARDREQHRLDLTRIAAVRGPDRDDDAANVVAESPIFHFFRDEI